jgi:16S rRNA (guanine527-N7)-methyltransferase
MRPPRIDSPKLFQAAFGVSRETLDRLGIYANLLARWQKTINLVAPSTIDDVWHRHFADSAQLWQYRPADARTWLDLGSGAGFPGLVLAILGAGSDSRHLLVESDNRKAAFLREVARETGVAVDILCMRIENAETRAKVGAVHCVTARALAPLPRLFELVAPYFGSSTLGLFLKGREVAAEIEETARRWQFAYELKPSMTEEGSSVVLLKALKPKTLQPKALGPKTEG